MARVKKGAAVAATGEKKAKSKTPASRAVRAIRLELNPRDAERVEKAASKKGLFMSAWARMVILERLESEGL